MRAEILFAVLALSGCGTSIDIPDGVFACVTETDCPEAFECRADGLCYTRTSPVPDGGDAEADGGLDATFDGGG